MFCITAKTDRDNGFISNTAIQVANEPLRLLISVQQGNLTREMIEESGIFNVSVLTENVPYDTIRHFGMQSGRDTDKFDDFLSVARTDNGLLYLTENTNAVFSCEVKEKIPLGSHTVFIGEVKEAKVLSDIPSCTYAHYHQSIKPKK